MGKVLDMFQTTNQKSTQIAGNSELYMSIPIRWHSFEGSFSMSHAEAMPIKHHINMYIRHHKANNKYRKIYPLVN